MAANLLSRLFCIAFAAAVVFSACGNGEPSASQVTVGPEVLQLRLSVSATAVRPSEPFVAKLYATNPSDYPAVARVNCFRYGLGLILRSPDGAVEDVFMGIPPCKVPNLPPTLRVDAGATDSTGAWWSRFPVTKPPGDYGLQVVYRTVDQRFEGPMITVRLLPPNEQ